MFGYIEDIVKRQKEFFKSGKTLEISFRKEQLKKLYTAIENNERELTEAVRKDLNKPEFETFETEIGLIKIDIKEAIKKIDKWSKPQNRGQSFMSPMAKNKIYKQPYGVCLILSPWNYPVQLSIEPLIGSISAGNCSVIKLSELSPNTSGVLKEILEDTFDENYVAVFDGDAEEGNYLINSEFDYIFYTGSPEIGSKVAVAAGKNLIPYTLELGGKSPCIVEKSADIDFTAKKIIWGKLLNSGQTCIAPDYIIADKSIYDELIKSMIKYVEKFYGKNPVESSDYPKIVNKKNYDRILSLIDSENIIYGGNSDDNSMKIAPTFLKVNNMNSKIMKEEIFGPVLPIITFEDKEEILDIVEKNKNPLALYIFTTDNSFEKEIINRISFGGGCINDTIMHCSISKLPFGGVGRSGIGSYHGKMSFDAFSHNKSIVKSGRTGDIFTSMKYPPYTEKNLKILKKLFKFMEI